MAVLQYSVTQDRASIAPEACRLGVLPLLLAALAVRPAAVEEEEVEGGAGAGGGAGTELRQAALSLVLELARTAGMWGEVRAAEGLREAVARLEARHAAMGEEEREAEQEEGELATELQVRCPWSLLSLTLFLCFFSPPPDPATLLTRALSPSPP
jgi:hypothetical protein